MSGGNGGIKLLQLGARPQAAAFNCSSRARGVRAGIAVARTQGSVLCGTFYCSSMEADIRTACAGSHLHLHFHSLLPPPCRWHPEEEKKERVWP